MDRRWDGVTMDRSCGGLSKEACLKAIAAGLSLDDIDGLITSAETRAEQTWAPRPYFAPPYDTEDGLTKASAEWIQRELGFKNVKYLQSDAPYIGPMMGLAQAVGDGVCETALWYPMVNLAGRYGHNNPQNINQEAPGRAPLPCRGGIRAARCSTISSSSSSTAKNTARPMTGWPPLFEFAPQRPEDPLGVLRAARALSAHP